MAERRVNPDTGVLEEHEASFWDLIFGERWDPVDFERPDDEDDDD